MRPLPYLLIGAIASLGLGAARAETIWSEDFTGQDGKGAWGPAPITYDTDGVTWTVDASGCTLGEGNDYAKVVSGAFETRDSNGEAIWRSPAVDISRHVAVGASVSLAETGDLENDDYIRVYYQLNGGTETLFTDGNQTDDMVPDGGPGTATVSGLTGSTFRIVVRIRNSSDDERHRLDSLVVTGTPKLPAPGWVVANPTNSFRFTARWLAVADAAGYRLDVASNAAFFASGTNMIQTGFEEADGWTSHNYGDWTETAHDGDWIGTSARAGAPGERTGSRGINFNGVSDALELPARDNPGTLTFWAALSSLPSGDNKLKVQRWNGSEWVDVTEFSITSTSFQQCSVTLARREAGVRLRLLCSNYNRTQYVDDLTLTEFTSHCARGYDARRVAGVTTTNVAVTGLVSQTTYYCRVRATNDVQTSTNSVVYSVTTRPPPGIAVGSVSAFGNVEVNTVSAEKSYTVSGSNLLGDVTLSPPAGFEIANASGGPYKANGETLTLTPVDGTLAETTIYAVFKPTAVAPYSGSISHASERATTRQVALSGTGVHSAESDLYSLGGEVANIAYHQYQATDIVRDGNSVDVAVFRLRDGGADGSDADTADTVLTAVTFAVDGHAYLRRVALYDQFDNELGETAAGGTVSFSGLNLVAPDGPAGAILILRVSFVTAVTDRERVRFTVTSVTAGAGGSGFAAADGGGATTAEDKNRIQVTATKLVFTDAPAVTGVGTNFALALEARDANGNLDLDRDSDVTLTRAVGTGTLYSATGLTRAFVSGEVDWSDVRVSRSGAFRIAAATTGLPPATTDVFRAYIHRERFETDGDGTRYTATGVHANEDAYFHRGRDGDFNNMAALTGEEGQWYFGGENTDEGPGEGLVTLNALDVSHYTNLQIEAALAATATDRFESGSGVNGDYVLVFTRLDDGPWRTNLAFRGAAASSAALSLDTDGDGVGDGAVLGPTFQDFVAAATNGGNSFQWRVVFRTTASGEEAAFDHLRVLGEALDRDSVILAPDEPLAATNVPAWADSAAEAVTTLRFRLRDPGTVDPYPTHPRRLVFVPGPDNTADWTDTIQDVSLTVGGVAVPLTAAEVTDTALTLDLAAGAFAVTNGATRDLRLAVYLQATGLVDRARLQFKIPAAGHGCLAEPGAHSRFAASFPADVVSAVHTVRVAATRLAFAPGAPPATVGVGRVFPVEVRALDANGNLDRSATAEVTLARQSGTGTLASVSGLTANLTVGTNRWTDVTMDTPGLFTIRASAAGLTTSVSAAVRAGEVWINEMDYDQDGTDTNEWVELAGAAGVCLNDLELALIRNDGTEYAVWDLAAANWTLADETNGWGFFTIGKVTPGEGRADYTPSGWDLNEVQNQQDVSAQLRRKSPTRNAHLLDYYGQNVATTEDQATALFDRTDAKSSLYLTAGPGSSFGGFVWANTAGRATPGRINDGQTFVPPVTHAARITPGAGAYRVDANAATLRGELLCGYPSPHVFICWGRNDAGSAFPGAWPYVVRLGPRSPGPFETELTGLARNTRYYYRCFATNALGVVPAVLATFQTLTTANTASYAVYVDDIGVATSPPQTVDVDGDGLPDAWEVQQLGSLTVSDGASDKDSDGDGWTDRQEYLAGTDPASAASFLRVTTAGLSSATSPDVVLRLAGGNVGAGGPLAQAGDAPNRVYRILAADGDAANPKTLLATVSDSLTGTNTYTDAGARDRIGSRYYSIAVSYAGGSYTNGEEWAVHTQRRPPASRSLACVPVDFGTAGNNLNAEAGRQLAIGLKAGSTGNPDSADRIQYQNAQRQWKEAHLITSGETTVWWDFDAGAPANVPLTPGMPLWVVRTAQLPARSNTVFAGRSFATSQTVNVTFTTNAGGWTMFGWPLGTKRHHRDLGAATPANQLGFEDRGVGGLHPELPAQKGDQIWVWENGGWRGRYWLMHTHGQAGGDQYNGRWWDSHRGRFADFALEAGKAYYYCHSTNWGGTNFVWRARVP